MGRIQRNGEIGEWRMGIGEWRDSLKPLTPNLQPLAFGALLAFSPEKLYS